MINHFKFCPKCGSEGLFFLESNKRVQCDNCQFIFYFNVAFAVAAVLEYEDKIVLTVRAHNPSKGKLDLPGGFVDKGETAEEAIIREIQEELGVTIQNPHYLCSFPNTYLYKNISYQTLDMVFHYRFYEKPHFIVSDDVSDFILVEKKEIPYSQIAFASLKNALESYSSVELSE